MKRLLFKDKKFQVEKENESINGSLPLKRRIVYLEVDGRGDSEESSGYNQDSGDVELSTSSQIRQVAMSSKDSFLISFYDNDDNLVNITDVSSGDDPANDGTYAIYFILSNFFGKAVVLYW